MHNKITLHKYMLINEKNPSEYLIYMHYKDIHAAWGHYWNFIAE